MAEQARLKTQSDYGVSLRWARPDFQEGHPAGARFIDWHMQKGQGDQG